MKLAGFAKRYPHELSGGQQQRVALARALAPRPAVILLDEPFNALDLDLRRSMSADVVSLLRRTQTTVILVAHDPSEAFACADLVAVIEGGTVVQCASPETVYRAPVSPGAARLTGPVIFLDGITQGGHVATPLGLIPADGPGVADGRLVKTMLRPEQIVPRGAEGGFEAQIKRQLFQGDYALLTLAVAGQRFDVRMPKAVEAPTINLRIEGLCRVFGGSPVGICCDHGRRVLTPRSGSLRSPRIKCRAAQRCASPDGLMSCTDRRCGPRDSSL